MFVFGSFLSPSEGLNLSRDILLALYLHTVSVHKHDTVVLSCQIVNIFRLLIHQLHKKYAVIRIFSSPLFSPVCCVHYVIGMMSLWIFVITYQKFTGVIADISS